MWQNNGFGSNNAFQNGFNNQESYQHSSFGASPGLPVAGQQYFPTQQNMMHYEDTNGEEFMNNDFQPEFGLYNEGAFMQNQFINANANAQFSTPSLNSTPSINPNPLRPVTQINARAAELKAELLKRREGRGNSTPPAGTPGQATKHVARVEGSSSLRGSPKIPITAEKEEQELNLNALISQYSESNPAANATVIQEKNLNEPNAATIQRTLNLSDSPAKSQAPSLGSPTKVTTPANNGKQLGYNNTSGSFGGRHTSNGSFSEGSEGEIREDATPAKLIQPPTPREAQLGPIIIKPEEQPSCRPRDDQAAKLAYNRAPRDDSPPRQLPSTNPKAPLQRIRDDRRDEFDSKSEQRHQPDYKIERKQYPEPDKRTYPRRSAREEEYRRTESVVESPREEFSRQAREREQKPPTLNDLLPHDEDLREWLDITGYHDVPKRNKILNRRRAIAALDAQRNKLLAEMEAEERGGLPAAIGSQTSTSSMLPPPIPNKVADRIEATLTSVGNSTVDTQRDRVVSNKRPYSDIQDPREEAIGGTVARIDGRPYSQKGKEEDELDYRRLRIKEEEDIDYRRPRASDLEPARRSSTDRRDERYDVRGQSREREVSPGRPAHEIRAAARSRRPYESDGSPYREEIPVLRPFQIRGGYRGRAFDPNYRGRGRGRARESSYVRDSRDLDSKTETGYGARIANGKPYKDLKGFDRSGKGDTRYFIVKSFNEENVLKCIQDSIWTTQVQNGSIFKEAFETCKNVILVFSINKSRAFQGYARMESLPGSVQVPDWQQSISWESAGAFRVRWLVICSTRFHRIGHLKNALNDNQPVLIGKDGQEIEENCGRGLLQLIDEEYDQAVSVWRFGGGEEDY